MFLGFDEPELVRVAKRVLRTGDTVYDAGAHVGYTCVLFASLVGSTGNVQAFELLPSTAAILRRTLDLNRLTNCMVHEVGLSDSDRSSRISINELCMGTSEFARGPDFNGQADDCRIYRLDSYRQLTPIPPPTLIKIDVEGAEVRALQGAEQTIRESGPLMIVEFHTAMLLVQGLDWLVDAGYEVRLPTGEQLTIRSAKNLQVFHRSVVCHQPDCAWHRERLGSLAGRVGSGGREGP
jgi:FkbM family methyltransferase